MKVLYYDCFSGISGDMNLGAMIDLGVDAEYLRSELGKLGLQGWKLEAERDHRHGIYGTKVTVKTRHEHAHRHLSDIEKIFDKSELNERVRELGKKIFMRIAVAEAKVHDIPVQKVHFHEVGAMDSIIDIAGAAICFDYLSPDEVHVSQVELGGGTVKCDHGKLPVPAPATAEIIKDIPASMGGVNFEATTPTGAAIITTLGTVFGKETAMKVLRTAYGVGHKEHREVPNLLRVMMGEKENIVARGHEAIKMECNIDDMNPEHIAYLTARLFEAGAADVFTSPVMMKKGRMGIELTVIAEKEHSGPLKEIVFTESTTIGIRTFPFMKDTLSRTAESINTSLGEVKIKKSFFNGRLVSVKPEYDDCEKIAIRTGKPVREVYRKIMSEIGAF
jgi:uncharacterized protein (TIGR00299 family) protein